MLEKKLSGQFENCLNNFGVISEDKIIINFQNRIISIKLEEITKIIFVKRRKLHLNFFLFVISTLSLIMVYYVNLFFIYQLIIFSIGLITLIMSYFFKSYEHKFVLIKKYDFFQFFIKKNLIRDVEDLVLKFNTHRNELTSVKQLVS